MEKKIAVLAGDGIGKEVMGEALKVLDAVAEKFNHKFKYGEALIGGAAYDKTGDPLPKETIRKCAESDAILLGAVGGKKWESLPAEKTPEAGLLKLRKEFDLFANLRPIEAFDALLENAPLKSEKIRGMDMLIVRELTSGLYFGKHTLKKGAASDVMEYRKSEIERALRVACEEAMKRKQKICSVDKANVLSTSRLWRKTAEEFVSKNYPSIELTHMYVDNAAMQLVLKPASFDVMVTENTFGDILSDLAAGVSGSIGLIPSASINAEGFGLFEPIHGSAPDIAGKGIANPIGQILSAGMMLSISFGLKKEAEAVKGAVKRALENGCRTADIVGKGEKTIGTAEMGSKIAGEITGK
jgi:3-isopropylmalate dehydrogenase